MNKLILAPLAAAATVAFVPQSFGQDQTTATATVGEEAPGFTLNDATGTEHSLEDFDGKIVVLEWVNFDCPYVANQYDSENITDLQKKYTEGDDGVVWLTVNSSADGKQGYLSDEEYTERAEEEGWSGTALLEDHNGEVGKLYGAKTTPHMYVIDEEGVLAYAGAIDSANTTDPEETADAENYVAAAIDSLRADEEIATAETEAYGCGVKYAD